MSVALRHPIEAAISHAIEAARLRLAVTGEDNDEADRWRACAAWHSRRSGSVLRWFVGMPGGLADDDA